ncbi:hypothetical protein ABPG75_007058 [Micractinium tetrahymenae]
MLASVQHGSKCSSSRGWQFVKQNGESIEQVLGGALRALLGELQAGSTSGCGTSSGSSGSTGAEPPDPPSTCSVPGTATIPAVVLSVAGRTDRGVSALGQLVLAAINAARPGLLRAWHVESVPRCFHATFKAQWRRYLYLLPLRTAGSGMAAAGTAGTAGAPAAGSAASQAGDDEEQAADFDAAAVEAAPDVDPDRVAALLARLEGRALDYTAFARGTPPGKNCVCRLLRARAWQATLPRPKATPVLAVELVGGRFLRRMGLLFLEAGYCPLPA